MQVLHVVADHRQRAVHEAVLAPMQVDVVLRQRTDRLLPLHHVDVLVELRELLL